MTEYNLKNIKEAKRRFIEHRVKFPNPETDAEILENFNKEIKRLEEK